MRGRGLLYFGLGILATLGVGAVGIRDDGIEFPDGSVQMTATQQRSFYMTASLHFGDSALTACAGGYHMANFWEIHDVAALRYAIEEPDAFTRDDSGAGAPTNRGGWVRTGNVSAGGALAGLSNCFTWTSADAGESGTQVRLTASDWVNETVSVISPWRASTILCSSQERVWCAQD